MIDIEEAVKVLKMKDQEGTAPDIEKTEYGIYAVCHFCKHRLCELLGIMFEMKADAFPRFCPNCGKRVKWE